MNVSEIQDRVNAVRKIMTEKGLIKPECQFTIKSDASPNVWVSWYSDPNRYIWDNSKHFRADDINGLFAAAMEWANALPSPEQERMRQFTDALATAIELGRANGIDVAYVNPLVEAMKRLSENAIEDHSND